MYRITGREQLWIFVQICAELVLKKDQLSETVVASRISALLSAARPQLYHTISLLHSVIMAGWFYWVKLLLTREKGKLTPAANGET